MVVAADVASVLPDAVQHVTADVVLHAIAVAVQLLRVVALLLLLQLADATANCHRA